MEKWIPTEIPSDEPIPFNVPHKDIFGDWLHEHIGSWVVLHYFDRETVAGYLQRYSTDTADLVSSGRDGRTYPILASLRDVRFIMATEGPKNGQ